MDDGVVRAADVTPTPVDWLWRERIPRRMITVVAGRPGQRKGLFCAHVASELSRQGMTVLYSCAEDSQGDMTRPRLEAAGADLQRVLLRINDLFLPNQTLELARIVTAHKVDLVILDPFNAHLGDRVSRHGDSIRRVTAPLKILAEKANAGVLIIEHMTKQIRGGDVLSGIGGSSSGLAAASRMAFVFGEDPDDQDASLLCHAKGNVRDRPPAVRFDTDIVDTGIGGQPTLIYVEEVEFEAMRLFKRGKAGRPAEKRKAAQEWLLTFLAKASGPVSAADVLRAGKEAKVGHKTLRAAATELGVRRDPPGGGAGCTWELPGLSEQDISKLLGAD